MIGHYRGRCGGAPVAQRQHARRYRLSGDAEARANVAEVRAPVNSQLFQARLVDIYGDGLNLNQANRRVQCSNKGLVACNQIGRAFHHDRIESNVSLDGDPPAREQLGPAGCCGFGGTDR